jgi:hypothetical protein
MQQGDAYFLKADEDKRESLSRFICFGSQSLSNANRNEGRQGMQLLAVVCSPTYAIFVAIKRVRHFRDPGPSSLGGACAGSLPTWVPTYLKNMLLPS